MRLKEGLEIAIGDKNFEVWKTVLKDTIDESECACNQNNYFKYPFGKEEGEFMYSILVRDMHHDWKGIFLEILYWQMETYTPETNESLMGRIDHYIKITPRWF